MATAHQLQTTDTLEQGVDEAIAACDGDACAAVMALLVIIELMEREQETLAGMVSNGYVQGRIAERMSRTRVH